MIGGRVNKSRAGFRDDIADKELHLGGDALDRTSRCGRGVNTLLDVAWIPVVTL